MMYDKVITHFPRGSDDSTDHVGYVDDGLCHTACGHEWVDKSGTGYGKARMTFSADLENATITNRCGRCPWDEHDPEP